jgi:hypothetical protein
LDEPKRPIAAFTQRDFLEPMEIWERSSGAVVHNCEGFDLEALMQDFDAGRPPFGAKDKKSQFPDAVAARILRTWAANQGTPIVVISRDHDWSSITANASELVGATMKEMMQYLALVEQRNLKGEEAFKIARGIVQSPPIIAAIIDRATGEVEGMSYHLSTQWEWGGVDDVAFDVDEVEVYLGGLSEGGAVAEISGSVRGSIKGRAELEGTPVGAYNREDSTQAFARRTALVQREVKLEFTGSVVLNALDVEEPILEVIDFETPDSRFGDRDVVPGSIWTENVAR